MNEIFGGRAILGTGAEDSAVFTINERPRGLRRLREYVLTRREFLRGAGTHFNWGRHSHAMDQDAKRQTCSHLDRRQSIMRRATVA